MASTSQDRKVMKARKVAQEIIVLCRMEDVSVSRSSLEATLALLLCDELSHRTLGALADRVADTREAILRRNGVPA